MHTGHVREHPPVEAGDPPDEVLLRSPARRRRSRRAVAVVAAVAVVLGVTAVVALVVRRPGGQHRAAAPTAPRTASTATAPAPRPTGTRIVQIGELSARVPARWFRAGYRGEPATVVFPLSFLATAAFPGPCGRAGKPDSGCTTQNWLPPGTATPADGLVITWIETQFPDPASKRPPAYLHGRPTTLAGHPALIDMGAAHNCPVGATSETDAQIATRLGGHGTVYWGERYTMTACFGPGVSPADRRAVATMLATLH